MYFANGILTTVSVLEWEEKTKNTAAIPVALSRAKIKKCNNWLTYDNDVVSIALAKHLLSYNSHDYNIPLFPHDVLIYPSPKISQIQYENRRALQIESYEGKIFAKLKQTFIFDARNGFLLEKRASYFDKNLAEKKGAVVIPSKYQFYNGLSFPRVLTLSFPQSENFLARIVISDPVKINEPIDRKEFVAVFPPKTEVRNEITKQKYITPALGNIGLESEIEKNLKELFNEAKK
jgi:hypothetical protein